MCAETISVESATTARIFDPLTINGLKIRNRVAVAPMTRVSATEQGHATDRMAPGGIVVFQEMELTTGRSYPLAPVVETTQVRILDFFSRVGVDAEMGPKLYAIFKAAGLPSPRLRVDGLVSGADGILPTLLANSVRALLPQLQTVDITNAEDVEIDTLEERLRADLVRTGGIITSPLYFGCWARSAE